MRTRARSITCAFLLLLAAHPAPAAPEDPAARLEPAWLSPAGRLSGESDEVRAKAIRKLRRTPDIETELRQALQGEHLYLALDAIVAMGLGSLFDDVVRASENDPGGFSYLALDALVDSAHHAALARLYRERVTRSSTPATAKVVILDSLIRMRERLETRALARLLLDDPSPEVKSAALYYLRGLLLGATSDPKKPEYLALLRQVLKSELSRQRKAQACTLVSEFHDPGLESQCEKLNAAAR